MLWRLGFELFITNNMFYLVRIYINILACFIIISCQKINTSSNVDPNFPSKQYVLDEFGQIVTTEFSLSDFESPQTCQQCHPNHYNDWSLSMHAYSMTDSIFFRGWNKAKSDFENTGERFCIQCHSPVAFLTGEDLTDFSSPTGIAESIVDGISCDVCHSITALSTTVHTQDNVAAVALYYLNPGEGVKYGSIENPEINSHHESEYNPIFHRSELCLPCHDLTIRGIEAEITFTEWERIPGLAMSGALSCQECHMPKKSDGTHDHRFVGVDIDLNYPIGQSPLHDAVQEMLKSAVDLQFGYPNYDLPDSVFIGNSLSIPVTVTSRTAHGLPSGTSFSREAWLEVKVTDAEADTLLYESGVVSNIASLDTSDIDLLLFTTTIIDNEEKETNSITHAHNIINQSLPAFSERYHSYQIENILSNSIIIDIRMLFRAFKPHHLEMHYNLIENLPIENLPIFEMASIRDTVYTKLSP